MKTNLWLITIIGSLFAAGSAFAQMGGGNMGPGGGNMGPGMGPGTGHMGGGAGYGIKGAGEMIQGMMGSTLSEGYVDVLNPINDPNEARAAFEAFLDASSSSLQISDLWEYGTVYKAELEDSNGQKAFDLIADKFTGVVMPEMGMSMMLNASYGKGLYKTSAFRRNVTVSPDQATNYAQNFVNNNGLGYVLGSPETYPGYYKFHTTSGGNPGLDIMVNGYNGKTWMNAMFGLPIRKY